MDRRKMLVVTAGAGLSAATGFAAFGQEKYPNRSIRLVVPHPVSGGVDIPARSLAEGLRVKLGQPVVVDNKPGAGGMIGAQIVATAAPDGYTLLMSSPGEIAIAPHLYKNMTYDPFKDLQPISLAARSPNVLIAGPSTSLQTAAEIIAQVTARPGSVTCGSSGIGSIQHLNIELFNRMAGVKVTHVPYKGSGPQNADLMAGQIDLGYSSVVGVLPLIRAGRLRPIAVTSLERVKALPDVPTLSETPALAGYDLNNWVGFLAPAGIPKSVLDTLHAAAYEVMSSAEWQKPIIDVGSIPSAGTPQEFSAFIAAESKKFGQIIKDTKITIEG